MGWYQSEFYRDLERVSLSIDVLRLARGYHFISYSCIRTQFDRLGIFTFQNVECQLFPPVMSNAVMTQSFQFGEHLRLSPRRATVLFGPISKM